MQIAIGQRRAEEVVVIGIRVGVMVAMNPPDFGQVQDGIQRLLQRRLRLQIAEEYDGGRPVLVDEIQHMAEVAMRVAAKENLAAH